MSLIFNDHAIIEAQLRILTTGVLNKKEVSYYDYRIFDVEKCDLFRIVYIFLGVVLSKYTLLSRP